MIVFVELGGIAAQEPSLSMLVRCARMYSFSKLFRFIWGTRYCPPLCAYYHLDDASVLIDSNALDSIKDFESFVQSCSEQLL